MVRTALAGRVTFHDGDEEIAPGISVHRIGGHSMGLQCVRVKTLRGHVVLASDAAHLYAHFEQGRVFPVVYNVGDVLEGYVKLKKLASSPKHIIPGHDPDVLDRYPPGRVGLDNWIARLDTDPSS
jgi:glyoxylase-like metal-dependent hydrolase (beta-lactamase superfamily II)